MKRQAITILFVLLAAGMLTQCRTKNDAKIDNTAVSTPEISVQSTISSHIDSAAAEVKEVAMQVEDTLQRAPDTLQVQPQGEPHKGFVYVKSLIPDLIEDLRYFTTNNFMGVRADGYEANHAILSKEAATALSKAADELREKGYVVKIYDAYRPQRAVDHFVRWSKTDDQRNKKDYYPDLVKKSLFPQYIATKSGHTKGSTIDMTICYKDTQKEVDMGGHFDYFGPPSHPTFTGKYPGGEVTPQHKKNRLMLRELMIRHGFKPYNSEWWHFTLKNEPYPTTFFNFPVK